jgi:hypothetical protein
MVTRAFALAVLAALAAAGCGHATARARTAVEPSASVSQSMQSLAGHWQGTVWETAASLYQGSTPLDLRLADDGTWRGTVGKAEGSGTARLDGRGRLVISGTAIAPDGTRDPVSFRLVGDSTRRWGQTVGRFHGRDGQGREEHASVSLRKGP